jgi:hypothetical protein
VVWTVPSIRLLAGLHAVLAADLVAGHLPLGEAEVPAKFVEVEDAAHLSPP